MDRMQNLAQAYYQAPWRRQVQIIGLFLLILVFIALVAGVYLNITARADSLGRDIQDMQEEIEVAQQENANLQSQLALLTSSQEMERRALEMGFRPVEMDESIFIEVPGYQERATAVIAPAQVAQTLPNTSLPPEYTESIFSWLQRQLILSPLFTLEVQP